MNTQKLENTLRWKPKESFETGLKKTLCWYLENPNWIAHTSSIEYEYWIEKQYT
jgi:dTDP-glucose 4,6-dehydratase